jgi:hypothetical protein
LLCQKYRLFEAVYSLGDFHQDVTIAYQVFLYSLGEVDSHCHDLSILGDRGVEDFDGYHVGCLCRSWTLVIGDVTAIGSADAVQYSEDPSFLILIRICGL